jgi:hypothetical protein
MGLAEHRLGRAFRGRSDGCVISTKIGRLLRPVRGRVPTARTSIRCLSKSPTLQLALGHPIVANEATGSSSSREVAENTVLITMPITDAIFRLIRSETQSVDMRESDHLAERFEARLIGLAAADAPPLVRPARSAP